MTVRHIAEQLDLAVACGREVVDRPVSGGYAGDLLSDVIAHSAAGQVWVTMQVHLNIVAVAVLKELSAIIIVNGRTPAEDTVRRATEERVPILVTPMPAFAVAGKLYGLGLTGEG